MTTQTKECLIKMSKGCRSLNRSFNDTKRQFTEKSKAEEYAEMPGRPTTVQEEQLTQEAAFTGQTGDRCRMGVTRR